MKEHIKTKEPSENLRRRKKDTYIQDSILSDNLVETINVKHLSLNKLIPFPGQARQNIDAATIKDLALSIKEHGLRSPLTVIESATETGVFEVISGERRLRALRLLERDKAPCVIVHDRQKAEEIALVENVQRKDLHPIELGLAYTRLMGDKHGYTQEKLAERLGVPRTQISECTKFARLHPEVASLLLLSNITNRNILRKLVSLPGKEQQISWLNSLVQGAKVKKQKKPFRRVSLIDVYYEDNKIKVDERYWRFSVAPPPLVLFRCLHKELSAVLERINVFLGAETPDEEV
jgi:ParB family chromosome partitioning protein